MLADETGEHTLTVPPRPTAGLAAYLAYIATILVVHQIGGVDYDEIADSSHNILLGMVVPVAAASAVVAVIATRLGWWAEIMREPRVGGRWLLAVPVVLLVGTAVALFAAPFGDWPTESVLLLLLGVALVGFGEELTTRGVLLVGMRGRFGEIWVWLITSGLFGLMHSLNLINGQAVGTTMQQVGFTFVIGSVLYTCRRATGLLIVPMALHALWDLTLLLGEGPGAETTREVSNAAAAQILAMYVTAALTIVFLVRLARGREQPAT